MAEKEMVVSNTKLPTFAHSDKGRGSEQVGGEDVLIPRIGIIQSLSPERSKKDPAYINGAEEGMMFNSVTRELISDGILAVPIFFRKEWILWRIREEGGGFKGVFPTESEAVRMRSSLPGTIDVVDTHQQFCLVSLDRGATWKEAVISMSKSNAAVSKAWNSDIRIRCADANGITVCDRFATIYSVGAVEKTNEKGTFYVFNTKFVGFVGDESLYKRAESVYEAISSGQKDISRDEPTGADDRDIDF